MVEPRGVEPNQNSQYLASCMKNIVIQPQNIAYFAHRSKSVVKRNVYQNVYLKKESHPISGWLFVGQFVPLRMVFVALIASGSWSM